MEKRQDPGCRRAIQHRPQPLFLENITVLLQFDLYCLYVGKLPVCMLSPVLRAGATLNPYAPVSN